MNEPKLIRNSPLQLENFKKIIKVALDIPLFTRFDYLAADIRADDIGSRVLVPFGKKKLVGIILDIDSHSELPANRVKSVITLLRDIPPLDHGLLDLFRFCSEYYHHPIGSVIMSALPAGMKSAMPVELKRNPVFSLTDTGRLTELPARSKNMNRLMALFRIHDSLDMASIKSEFPSTVLKKMLELGLVHEIPVPEEQLQIAPSPALTPEQGHASSCIIENLGDFHPWLLYGITGSGKTEVYLQVIARVLQSGKQVLFLVPEINLTPQLENLFRSRFPKTTVVSLHSGLNDTQRMQGWLNAQAGIAGIVLGTRLAVFTPLPSLGLIIVDEEHDSSFKQQEGLRYCARDVAVFRGKQQSVPVILGSATPSLESFHSAQRGRYKLLRLALRAVPNAVLPEVRFIDLRVEKRRGGLSKTLVDALSSRLERREQSLVFVNRRGYAPALICSACSWTPCCRRCTSKLVLHLKDRKLRCHYCGFEEKVTQYCPECGNLDLKPVGHGTQRIEEELNALFPEARILRIDRDSIRKKKAWGEMLEKIRSNEVDILVGTQILAKGHDFPNLTLVGILNSDASLYSSDFRASERLFAQLTQVSGRAGRAGTPGEVLIQTEFQDHPLYAALKKHDYDAIAAMLLEERAAAGFPPYVHQALIRAESRTLEASMDFLVKTASLASKSDHGVTVYEPAIASMARLDNMERAQILFQSASRQRLQNFLNDLMSNLDCAPDRSVRWHVDVDPLEF
ncbi:MAG: primosomal protein N' [Burkholderiales bacterium]|nr:primosomal protein N' [Burkholderiales bacterium]